GSDDAGDLVEAAGDDVVEFLVAPDPDHRHEVVFTGDGVDLADAVQGGDRLGDLVDARDVGLDEHDRGDHFVLPLRCSTFRPYRGAGQPRLRAARWPVGPARRARSAKTTPATKP